MIEIKVRNKIASLVNQDDYIVCGNTDYVISFDFDEEWNSFNAKTARFVAYDGHNVTYQDVAFTGTSCNTPNITDASFVKIGVYAGNLHTTTPASIDAVKSITSGSGVHVTPPTDVYNQLITLINTLSAGKGDNLVYENSKLKLMAGDVVLSEVTIQGGGSADHSQLTNLDYANSGHTGFAQASHSHTKADISDFSHNHDDRYYTESEIDTALSGKSDTGHNHDNRYYTETEVDTALGGKSNTGHTHTKSEITDFAHNHDDRYYTETEADAKFLTEHQSLSAYRTSANQDIIDAGKAAVGSSYTKSESDAKYLTEHQSLKTINNTSLVGSGNIDTKEIEVLTLDSTYAEAVAAYNAGKILVLKANSNDYALVQYYNELFTFAGICYFETSGDTWVSSYKLSADGWSDLLCTMIVPQVYEMPEASYSLVDCCYCQYIGETNSTYTHGRFYECIETDDTCVWHELQVQDLSAYRTSSAQDTIDAGKVDKVTGKGLSTEDYTTAEKTKLAGIEAGADVTDATNVANAGAEMTSNKVTSISSSSTDTQYPSAKLLYDIVGNIESLLEALL